MPAEDVVAATADDVGGEEGEGGGDEMTGVEQTGEGEENEGGGEVVKDEEAQQQQQQANENTTAAPEPQNLPEPRIPVKKDVTLREFLGKMDDYAPIVSSSPPSLPSQKNPPY